MRRRNDGDTNRQTRRQQAVERTHRGVLARFIRIEAQHHLVHVTFDDAGVVSREGGALRRDDVLHSGHEAGNQIKLPLADHREACVE